MSEYEWEQWELDMIERRKQGLPWTPDETQQWHDRSVAYFERLLAEREGRANNADR